MSKPEPPALLTFLQDAVAYVKALEEREDALRSLTGETFEGLKAVADSLTGEQKVELIRAMGFSPVGADHQDDCIRYTHGSGFRCGCVPPATVWVQPKDVDIIRGETWDDRRALAVRWEREGSHGRRKDED